MVQLIQASGRLPNDPETLEKEIEGVGRYTAGAICSMAYGVHTPVVSVMDRTTLLAHTHQVDGNIHRLLTRVLALHAVQTAPQTIRFLWTAATELIQRLPSEGGRPGVAGDWNQVSVYRLTRSRC